MKKWSFLAAGLILMVSFQNCSKVASPLLESNQGADLVADVKQVSVADFETLTIAKYPNIDNPQYKYYKINIKDGDVIAVERSHTGAEVSSQLCLQDSEKVNLQAILSSAMICETILNYNLVKDMVCTQNYTYPYASLSNLLEERRLGEKTSGCDVPDDLCGEKSQALKDFVQNLLSVIDENHSCP